MPPALIASFLLPEIARDPQNLIRGFSPCGYVHMPSVEIVKEMVDMMAASRGYEGQCDRNPRRPQNGRFHDESPEELECLNRLFRLVLHSGTEFEMPIHSTGNLSLLVL